MKIQKILESVNLAEELSEEKLQKIGSNVVEGFERDLDSRKPWELDIDKWTELALQISKQKTFPWPNASNVKFPLLATASMQFAARAYPSLVPSDGKIVKTITNGFDPEGQKSARASRISKHMSYQLMVEMEDWEEDMDRLLIILPIIGTVFKKTYWDSNRQTNRSTLVLPKNLVVNYWAKSLEEAERKTEWFELSKRKVKERQLQGIYSDIDLPTPRVAGLNMDKIKAVSQLASEEDETTPYTILEQHTYLDLDNDGYAEPYIVTVEYESKKVLRIVARFSAEDVLVDDKEKVVKISPTEYYTKYSFVLNPDGGFYDIGFGRLLGTINASADTIINQLIDAGTLSNLQAGFIGKGLKIRMGESRFQPGEWKAVNATGDDLKKQIMPLPVNPPNPVLLQLLQFLIQSGRDLASVAEIMTGKMPGQNTPATTTMATIEQGMKVFTAVYKRVYRSMTKEFRKLYKLNAQYLDPTTYLSFLDQPLEQSDYFGDPNDVIPAADPNASSSQEKQAKAQVLVQMLGLGTLNPMAVTQFMLEAHDIPQPEKFLMQPQPQVDPKAEALKMKAQLDQQKAQADMEMNAKKLQIQMAGEAQKQELEAAAKEQELKFKMIQNALEVEKAQSTHAMNTQQSSDNHILNMMHKEQQFQQSRRQQRETPQKKR